MKLKVVLVTALTVIIGVQLYYIIQRVRSTASSMATRPMRQPMGRPMPAPAGEPPPASSMPPAEEVVPVAGSTTARGMPSVPHGPGAVGPAPGGGPSAMGGATPIGPEQLPYNEILADLVKLQEEPRLAFNNRQKARARAVLRTMGTLIGRPPPPVAMLAMQTLRAEQIAYMAAHRLEPPPLDPANPTVMPGPDSTDAAVVRLLKARSAESGPSTALPTLGTAPIGPGPLAEEDLMGGLLKMEKEKKFAVTPAQAASLLGPIAQLAALRKALDVKKHALLAIATRAQKEELMSIHDQTMSQGMVMSSPQELLANLIKRLQ